MKKIFIILIGLIVLLTVIGLFLPSKVEVKRSIIVNTSADKLYLMIADFKQWDLWSPWHQMDPQMEKIFNDIPPGVGSAYSWKSNHDQVGTGSILTTEAEENKHLRMEMKFGDRLAYAQFDLKSLENNTEVTWSFESDMGFNPFYRLLGLAMKYFIAKDYEKGLENLQKVMK